MKDYYVTTRVFIANEKQMVFKGAGQKDNRTFSGMTNKTEQRELIMKHRNIKIDT